MKCNVNYLVKENDLKKLLSEHMKNENDESALFY